MPVTCHSCVHVTGSCPDPRAGRRAQLDASYGAVGATMPTLVAVRPRGGDGASLHEAAQRVVWLEGPFPQHAFQHNY